MKKICILRHSVLLLFIFLASESIGMDLFTIAMKRDKTLTAIPFMQTVDGSTFFHMPSSKQPIDGLCINGKITKTDEDYFVRILLADKKGNEYVVLEKYKELADSASLILNDYCEETALLPSVEADTIKVFIHHAIFQLDNVVVSYAPDKGRTDASSLQEQTQLLRQKQVEAKANWINKYNKKNKKLWFAGVTDLCMTDFSSRMRLLGFSESQNTGGLEYYIGGIFEMGGPTLRNTPNPSPFVSSFDWRDRHGKNWMTSVKNQGASNYCAAFSSVAALEALTNIYFNKSLNVDLSEQEAARCGYGAPSIYYVGMPLISPVSYIAQHGLCDEQSYPFIDASVADCIRDQITPIYTVQPDGFRTINSDYDSIKYELIHHGPLVSGYHNTDGNTIIDGGHAMALAGYGTIQAGDIYTTYDNGVIIETDSIDVRDERIGLTYWIFKNSYLGEHNWEHGGYMYLIFNNPELMVQPFAFDIPIATFGIGNAEVEWTDEDGDGYYFWGIGSKPSSCPYWVPNIPDGNDSNPQGGAMDNYGYVASIGPTTSTSTIVDSVSYNTNQGLKHDVVVSNGGVLTISSEIVMANCKIHVNNGGTLIVDQGRLLHADIELDAASHLIIKNNGLIHMKPGKHFSAPVGSIVDIKSGEIS